MPKKQVHPDPVPPGAVHVRLEISREQQAELRVLAAQAGMSMAAFARAIVAEKLAEHAQRVGAPPRPPKGKGGAKP